MTSPNKRFVIYLCVIVLRASNVDLSSTEADILCDSKKQDRGRYPECMNVEGSTILWCDYSLHKSIPRPDSLRKPEAAKKATTLLVNDSCLSSINIGDLAGYPKLKKVDLSQNFIREITEPVFRGNEDLEQINLSHNFLSKITKDAFTNLIKVTNLTLDYNRLTKLEDRNFMHLQSLRILSLRGNNLEEIRTGNFYALESLAFLDLRDNGIKTIEDFALNSLTSLIHLHLDNNNLRADSEHMFAGLNNVQNLTLSHNLFTSWPVGYSYIFTSLRSLNLSSSGLEDVTSKTFANLTTLERIYLSNNKLKNVPESLFKGNLHLECIDFSSNFDIKEIPRNTFVHLRRLRTLLLRDNELTIPHKEWFEQLSKQPDEIFVNISGNEWNCDCDILDFQKYVESLEKSERKSSQLLAKQLQIKCSTPKNRKGITLNKDMALSIKADGCFKTTIPPPPATTTTTTSSSTKSRDQEIQTTTSEVVASSSTNPTTIPTTKQNTEATQTPFPNKLPTLKTAELSNNGTSSQFGEKMNLTAIIISLAAVIIILIVGFFLQRKCKISIRSRTKENSKHHRNDSTDPFLNESVAVTIEQPLDELISSGSITDNKDFIRQTNNQQSRPLPPVVQSQPSFSRNRSTLGTQYEQSDLTYQSMAPAVFEPPNCAATDAQTAPQPQEQGPSLSYRAQATRPKQLRSSGYGSLDEAESQNSIDRLDEITSLSSAQEMARTSRCRQSPRKSLCDNCGHECELPAPETRPKELYTAGEYSLGASEISTRATSVTSLKEVVKANFKEDIIKCSSTEELFESCESLNQKSKKKKIKNALLDSYEALPSLEYFSLESRADGDGAESHDSPFPSLQQFQPLT